MVDVKVNAVANPYGSLDFLSTLEKRQFFWGLMEISGSILLYIRRYKRQSDVLQACFRLQLENNDSSRAFLNSLRHQLGFGRVSLKSEAFLTSASKAAANFLATYSSHYDILELGIRRQNQLLKHKFIHELQEELIYDAVQDKLNIFKKFSMLTSSKLTCQEHVIVWEQLKYLDQIWRSTMSSDGAAEQISTFLDSPKLGQILAAKKFAIEGQYIVQQASRELKGHYLKAKVENYSLSNQQVWCTYSDIKDDCRKVVNCSQYFCDKDINVVIGYMNYQQRSSSQKLYGILQRLGKFILIRYPYKNKFALRFRVGTTLGSASILHEIRLFSQCSNSIVKYNAHLPCCSAVDAQLNYSSKQEARLNCSGSIFTIYVQNQLLQFILKIMDNEVINPVLSSKFKDAYYLLSILSAMDHSDPQSIIQLFEFYKKSSLGNSQKSATMDRWKLSISRDQSKGASMHAVDNDIINSSICTSATLVHSENVQRRLSSSRKLSSIGITEHTSVALIQETGRHINNLALNDQQFSIIESRRTFHHGGILLAVKQPQKIVDWAITATAVFATIKQPGVPNHLRAASIYMPPAQSPLLLNGRINIERQFGLLADLAKSQLSAYETEVHRQKNRKPRSELDQWLEEVQAKDGWLSSAGGLVVEGVGEQSYHEYLQHTKHKGPGLTPLLGRRQGNQLVLDPDVNIQGDQLTIFNPDQLIQDTYKICTSTQCAQQLDSQQMDCGNNEVQHSASYITAQSTQKQAQLVEPPAAHAQGISFSNASATHCSNVVSTSTKFRACYGGDFNPGSGPLRLAHPSQSAHSTLPRRQRLIRRFMDALDLHLLNGTDPPRNGQATFCNSRGHVSTPDLMLVSQGFREELERGGGGMLIAKGVGDHRALLTFSGGTESKAS